jgi:hypothetical protein
MEKYMINNLEEFAISLANSIKRMSIKDMTKEKYTLEEYIAAIVRGCPFCSEMKVKKKNK